MTLSNGLKLLPASHEPGCNVYEVVDGESLEPILGIPLALRTNDGAMVETVETLLNALLRVVQADGE